MGKWKIVLFHPGRGPLGYGHPEKEPMKERREAGLPAFYSAPGGLSWPQEATETALGVPGAAALCLPVPRLMGRGPAACQAWAALPEPHLGPHPGHSSVFALGSGRWMGCQSLPPLPDGSEDTAGMGTRQPEASVPVSQLQSHLGLCSREKRASEGWRCMRAPAPLLTSSHESHKGRTGLDPSWLRNRLSQPSPGGLSLPTILGVAVLSLGTNVTKPECNRSNKQGLWQQERAVEPCLVAN